MRKTNLNFYGADKIVVSINGEAGKKLNLIDKKVRGVFEKRVTEFGNSRKIDCPKQFSGCRVYVVVCND